MFLSILASDANFNVHESKIGTQKYMYGTADISTNCDSKMYELEGEREFCHFSSLSVEITSCSSFLLGEFRFVWWEKVVIDPECDILILKKILVQEKRGPKKKEKSE